MVKLLWSVLVFLLLVPISAPAETITCESVDGRYKECTMDTRGTVRVIRQISDSKCVKGVNWGVKQNSIWVNSGCRAEFQSDGASWGGVARNRSLGNLSRRVTCESVNNLTKECAMDTGGNVRITRQISDTKCVQGTNWGVNGDSVWVDDGCRAVFESDGSYSRRSLDYNSSGSLPTRVTCESQKNRSKECAINTRGGVRLVRNLSDTRCVEGTNWTQSKNSITVDDGCRAEFQSIGGHWGGNPANILFSSAPTKIACESEGGRLKECNMNTQGTVRLTRQNSSTKCVQGVNWGVNKNSVWVKDGCRAVFELERSGGVPSSALVNACNSERNRNGEVVSYAPLKTSAWEIILKYSDGEYVCNVTRDGRITYFERLLRR